jgi:hypothetical protein
MPNAIVTSVHEFLSVIAHCVTGEWRKLHNEELNDLYSLPQYCAGGKIKKNEMGRACGAYGVGKRCAQGVGGET